MLKLDSHTESRVQYKDKHQEAKNPKLDTIQSQIQSQAQSLHRLHSHTESGTKKSKIDSAHSCIKSQRPKVKAKPTTEKHNQIESQSQF